MLVGWMCVLALAAVAAPSPGEIGDYTPQPQSSYEAALSRYEAAVRNVRVAEKRVDAAAADVRLAERQYAEYAARRRDQPQGDPMLREAAEQVTAAERRVDQRRETALAPLGREPLYRRQLAELEASRRSMDELQEARLKSRYGGLFTPAQRRRTHELAGRIAALDHAVYQRRLEVLEDNADYLAARQQLSDARAQVQQLLETAVRVDASDPDRRRMVKLLQTASTEQVSAERALLDARRARHRAYADLLATVAESEPQ